MLKHRTEAVIADLVEAAHGGQAGRSGRRKRHVLRQALYALVRLAKVEQLVDMRLDAERATGGMVGAGQRRQTKALLRKIGMDVDADQARLERDWAAARDAKPVSSAKAARNEQIFRRDANPVSSANAAQGEKNFRSVENDCGKT
ncbi:hypothetical protein [Pseudoduganella umbonata]|uniref:Uncharacterized protein n=1 Tax=Pseudoduganella umbonata TaxID=864828 RepID=A0A4P8HYR0_9BURK|nr:hypothetical protein [Pseudoduganella umbonata]MBB3223406.1 hypothetical protein [Pseudoduganella umbonata]QCP13694.1 hypothetical protein FCL38_27140 [Pseudoduganella umbonata]